MEERQRGGERQDERQEEGEDEDTRGGIELQQCLKTIEQGRTREQRVTK